MAGLAGHCLSFVMAGLVPATCGTRFQQFSPLIPAKAGIQG